MSTRTNSPFAVWLHVSTRGAGGGACTSVFSYACNECSNASSRSPSRIQSYDHCAARATMRISSAAPTAASSAIDR